MLERKFKILIESKTLKYLVSFKISILIVCDDRVPFPFSFKMQTINKRRESKLTQRVYYTRIIG